MSERISRLVMNRFRGVPRRMVVDFGEGQSMAILGDNGTAKSTIADALEWYFTGDIELLAHEGRQHAVRSVGGPTDEKTWVELVTTGTLGGIATYPEQRRGEILDVAGRETFLLRGRASATEIESALKRIDKLDAAWSCPTCETRLWLRGTPESSQCGCGRSRFPPVPPP